MNKVLQPGQDLCSISDGGPLKSVIFSFP